MASTRNGLPLFASLLYITASSTQVAAHFYCADGSTPMVHQDFSHRTHGEPYTNVSIREDFPGLMWMKEVDVTARTVLVDGDVDDVEPTENNTALSVVYPQHCFNTDACAIQFKVRLDQNTTEAWIAYRVRFEQGFEFNLGGKLPGLCGGRCNTGGYRSDGIDGFSARVMWREEGRVVQYLYYANQPDVFGQDLNWTRSDGSQARFLPGKWHTLMTRVKLNDVGKANGIVESYMDGSLALVQTGIEWRWSHNITINIFYFSTFFGGNNYTWESPQNQEATFDDFIVCKGGVGIVRQTHLNKKITGSKDMGENYLLKDVTELVHNADSGEMKGIANHHKTEHKNTNKDLLPLSERKEVLVRLFAKAGPMLVPLVILFVFVCWAWCVMLKNVYARYRNRDLGFQKHKEKDSNESMVSLL
eukprot:comp34531_c0_seq1/m.47304 comp34531_c0_seq1/g.47304  ORF comp34531_c0_seq1/g.47304 comp34531_c0_seq1/m.47304 type:complete len:417 (-) comp34531_c0_seq1:58-1308(-)